MADTTGIVITLIHGTWARRARWTQPDSVLCRHLKRALPQLREIKAFRWSGSNFQFRRQRAARELLAWHEQVRLRHASARHFLIAHSHGGNVALEAALQDKAFRAGVGGIICLSTPFLQFSAREQAPAGVLFPLAILGTLLFVLMSFYALAPFWIYGLTGLLVLLVVLSNAAKLFDVAKRVEQLDFTWLRLIDWEAGAARQSAALTAIPNVLIVRSPGDEATSLLGFLQLLSWIASRIFLLAERIIDGLLLFAEEYAILWWLTVLAAVSGLAFLALMVCVWLGWSLDSHYASWFGAWLQGNVPLKPSLWLLEPQLWMKRPFGLAVWCVIIACVATAILWLLAALVVFTLGSVLYLSRLAFGFVVPIRVFREAISAEACPPGRWTVIEASLSERTASLSHSEPYSQASVLQQVSDWILQPR